VNLLSLVQRMAEPDRPPIALDAEGCLHARNRFSTCDACISICPVNALSLVPPIMLDLEACVACGACLPVCPVGALTGKDGSDDLVTCVSKLPDARVVEIACARHTAPEIGPAESTAVIRTDGCLAALGASTYEWLLANGTQQVTVRLDACKSCSIERLQPQISRIVGAVNRLASEGGHLTPPEIESASTVTEALPPGQATRIVEIRDRGENWQTRMVVPAKNPPVSRRDLFRSFVSEGPKMAAQALSFQSAKVSLGKAPPLERRRMLNSLRRQAADGAAMVAPGNDLGLVRMAATEQCTACGVCARVCPTGALVFEDRETTFRLSFSASACTDCGACLDLCEPNALYRAGVPTLQELLATEPAVLRTDPLHKCDKCGAKFAGASPGKLCPTCDFRVHNPFGSRQPARIPRRS
jgi:ferredoxin